MEPSPRWVRVVAGGTVIADSRRVLLLREVGHLPVYYFPRADVRMDLLVPNGVVTRCPYKGEATHFDLRSGSQETSEAAWSYQDPTPDRQDIAGLVAFYWDRVDHWYEEEEEVFKHPRDPYHRVDAIVSSRHVQVWLAGVQVADSRSPVLVFETRLPTRYYLSPEDVRMDLLQRSETRSVCPYKGVAGYWTATIFGQPHHDVAWTYHNPLPGVAAIRHRLAFYPERVQEIRVDGQRVPNPSSW